MTIREALRFGRALDALAAVCDEWTHNHRERTGMRPDAKVEYRRAMRAKRREMEATREELRS